MYIYIYTYSAGAEEGMRAAVDAMSSHEVIIFSLPHQHFRRDPWRQRDLHGMQLATSQRSLLWGGYD